MRITFDPDADAVYIRLSGPDPDNVGDTDVTENGVIVDTDIKGNPRGFEFLSVSHNGLPTQGLPENVAQAIRAFIASGALDAPSQVERDFP